jgi:hypothetical protein
MAPSRPDVTKTLGNNTNPVWWKDPGMRKLNFMIVCVITAQMTCGYDEAVVGNFQAMKPWLKGTFWILPELAPFLEQLREEAELTPLRYVVP